MQIRLMAISDYDAVYALWLRTPGLGMSEADDSREGIARYLARNPTTCFVAEHGGALCGVLLCGHDGRRGFLYHMAVDETCRRQGVGAQMVAQALAALRAEGISKAALLAFARNEGGNAFWASQGFVARDDVVYRNQELAPQCGCGCGGDSCSC